MILFVLTGSAPPWLIVLLGFLVYLSWIDLRSEPLAPRAKLWWYLLVFLTNVVGYIALRVWLLTRRRRAA